MPTAAECMRYVLCLSSCLGSDSDCFWQQQNRNQRCDFSRLTGSNPLQGQGEGANDGGTLPQLKLLLAGQVATTFYLVLGTLWLPSGSWLHHMAGFSSVSVLFPWHHTKSLFCSCHISSKKFCHQSPAHVVLTLFYLYPAVAEVILASHQSVILDLFFLSSFFSLLSVGSYPQTLILEIIFVLTSAGWLSTFGIKSW